MAMTDHQIGDRVFFRAGKHSGRAQIVAIHETTATVEDWDAHTFDVPLATLTNRSAIARAAWVAHPNRPVGRRKGSTPGRKLFSQRLPEKLMSEAAEAAGRLGLSRDRFVEHAIREKLARLEDGDGSTIG